MDATKDPKDWAPSVEQIIGIQNSDLLIVNGPNARYANWIDVSTIPLKLICKSCNLFSKGDTISVRDYQITHTHGPEGEHSHPYTVPYSWLDPSLAAKQAQAICIRLCEEYPDYKETFKNNESELIAELGKLTELARTNSEEVTVVSSSPQAKYLTRCLGLKDLHLLAFDNVTPDDLGQMEKSLEQWIGEKRISKFVVFQDTDSELIKLAQQKNLDVIEVDLLDHAPKEGDFLTVLNSNLKKLID